MNKELLERTIKFLSGTLWETDTAATEGDALLLALKAELEKVERRAAETEQLMRQLSWKPIAEYLRGCGCDPSMTVLMHIRPELHNEAKEELEHYATRPAFFNLDQCELMEVGSWSALHRAIYGELTDEELRRQFDERLPF